MADDTHTFAARVFGILVARFGEELGVRLMQESPLIGYLLTKTKAANRGSKSRGSFANLYAIYVLVEDYLARGYGAAGVYDEYEGAKFRDLFARQRELPFGEKLQNHALNSRLNDEFHKYYPTVDSRPILRDVATQRYWINEGLLISHGVNVAEAVIEVIDAYIDARRGSFAKFIDDCRRIQALDHSAADEKRAYIASLLEPSTDARLFEIVSFAIMKTHYGGQTVWFGYRREDVEERALVLYKTGRTNANDGGIDFVMRPVGRFFQVTETLDLKKYFLDLDKIQKFPMTFVIKSERSIEDIKEHLQRGAEATFGIKSIVANYMDAIEEIVNIPRLLQYLDMSVTNGKIEALIDEVVLQSQVEFNLSEDEEAMIKTMDQDGVAVAPLLDR